MSLQFNGAFIDGSFQKIDRGISHLNQNPFKLSEPHFAWNEDVSLVKPAVEAAKKAFLAWKELALEKKVEVFQRLKTEFQKKAPEIEEAIILEIGKARWEANQEAQLLASKIDITISTMIPLMKEMADKARTPGQAELHWIPRGVCAVIGPFNFPLHLPNGHIIPAILAGNSVIFKPSEYAPASASLYAECFKAAGFPPGVFQMLPGASKTGAALVETPGVEGIFFTGSYEVGKRIVESLLKNRSDLDTLAALELGGKNASVVHHDASLEKSCFEILISAYATAGQRCSSTSRVLVHSKIYDSFKSRILELAKKMKIGNPSEASTFMGPLVHEAAISKFLGALNQTKKEGLNSLLESERISKDSCLVGPSIYECDKALALKSQSFQDEFFGPNFILVPYETEADALELHEATPYGLVASVFSENKAFDEFCSRNFRVGLLNFNRGTVGASSKLPFGGYKRSGNNWPAGMFSFFYCIRPQARLTESSHLDVQKLPESLRALALK